MMEEIKQDWLSLVEKAVYHELSTSDSDVKNFPLPCSRSVPQALTVVNSSRQQIPLQKLLFSATLSEDPEKLHQLKLFQPILFTSTVKRRQQRTTTDGSQHPTAADGIGEPPAETSCKNSEKRRTSVSEKDVGEFIGKYTTPIGLTEKFVECSKTQKPLTLLYILRQMKFGRVLCFTNSVGSTHRLFHLMKLVGGGVQVSEFSSQLQAVRRNRILKRFAAGKIQLLICSDAIARGIDVIDIDCVVSYDVPRVFATYVHRVGRTARAGRCGTAITLLEKHEIFHFKRLLNLAGKTDVKELKLKSADLKAYVEPLTKALEQLPTMLAAEAKSRNIQR
jgi:ATP-dependent RNA helicase DDX51/DBP6